MRKELIAVMDKYQMNWIEGATEWGTVKTPPQISVQVCCTEEKDIITERYRFTNTSDKPFFYLLRILAFIHLLMMIIVVLIFVLKCVATHIFIVVERCRM